MHRAGIRCAGGASAATSTSTATCEEEEEEEEERYLEALLIVLLYLARVHAALEHGLAEGPQRPEQIPRELDPLSQRPQV